jgi:hypothetical protein
MIWKHLDCTSQCTNRNFETRQGVWRNCKEINSFQLKSNDLEAFRIAPATARLETLRSVQEFQENHSFSIEKSWKHVDCTCHYTNRNFEKLQGIHCFSIEKQWFGSILIAPANTRIESLRGVKNSLLFNCEAKTWKHFDCNCQYTKRRSFETSRRFKEFIALVRKQWFGSIWVAPASTRIETLRSFKESVAFELKSNDLDAVWLHLSIHE